MEQRRASLGGALWGYDPETEDRMHAVHSIKARKAGHGRNPKKEC